LVVSGESTGFLPGNRVVTSNVSTCNYLCIQQYFAVFDVFRCFSTFFSKKVIFIHIDVQNGTHSYFSGKGVILIAEVTVDQVNFGNFW
jgi:hypothetical protein